MRWGVVVFPGSNDDRDALRAAERVLGDEAVALWHKDRFRRDLGGVEDAYQEAARRICSAAA